VKDKLELTNVEKGV